MKKMIKRLVIVLAALILAAVIAVMALFGREIQTIRSIRQVDEAGMLMIDVTADYGLSELVASGGVSSDSELVSFVVRHLLKGIPLQFNIPDFGCSTFQARTAEGEWLFGRNYDLNDIPGMIVRTDPQDGYASISIANISVLGYDDDHLPDSFLSGIISHTRSRVADGRDERDGIFDWRAADPGCGTDASGSGWTGYDDDSRHALAAGSGGGCGRGDRHAGKYGYALRPPTRPIISDGGCERQQRGGGICDNELRVIRKQPQQQQMLTNFLISEDVYGLVRGRIAMRFCSRRWKKTKEF